MKSGIARQSPWDVHVFRIGVLYWGIASSSRAWIFECLVLDEDCLVFLALSFERRRLSSQ